MAEEEITAVALKWVKAEGFEVVFDMDHTMSGGHCGTGQLASSLHEYVGKTSADFVAFARALAAAGIKLAVATGSDALEYDLPGQSSETHLCGGDLARSVIEMKCPDLLEKFEILIGFDHRLHHDKMGPEYKGKRHHMRLIASHYKCNFSNMVLFDDTRKNLENEDGWYGVLVHNPHLGFRFEDLTRCDRYSELKE